jgi:hypothetical protein
MTNEPAGQGPAERTVRPVAEALRWWRCDTHGSGKLAAWGCPDCVAELRRWKSTHAPRLAALEGLYEKAQADAEAGREAVATLASERAANAVLTNEVERLRTALQALVNALDSGHSLTIIDAWTGAESALGPNKAIR